MLTQRWTVEIWLAMLLVVYVTMRELGRVIGTDQLNEMFFGRGVKSAKGEYSRDAA